MITILNDSPENVAAFNATGQINREDFENIVIPHVKDKVDRFKELNYLLYLDADLDGSNVKSWLSQALSNLNSISQYNRVAIVSDYHDVQSFTKITGCENFKIFKKEDVYNALFWCNKGIEPER